MTDPKSIWNTLVRLEQPSLDDVQARCAVWQPSLDDDQDIYLGDNLVVNAKLPLFLRELFASGDSPEAGAIAQLLLVVTPERYPRQSDWIMHPLPNYNLLGVPIHSTAAEFLASLAARGQAADAVPSTLTDIYGRKALLLCIGKNLQIEFRSEDEKNPLPQTATPYTIAFTFDGADHIDPCLD